MKTTTAPGFAGAHRPALPLEHTSWLWRWISGLARAAVLQAGLALAAPGPADLAQSRLDHPASVVTLADEVRDQGWICFGARSQAGDWDLFVCRPDGSALQNLTRTPLFSEFSPQFSRDGRRLLYRRGTRNERLDNNRHGEQGQLVLANADASHPIVLGGVGELTWASFSPDGRQIASLSIKGIAFYDLERRAVVRTLPRKGFFQQVTWSPDGRWLVGVANSFGTGWSVARMDTATGEVGAVNRVDCCTPDWFPDSREVVFSWRPPGQKVNNGYGWTQLWRATADGQSRQLVYGEDGRHVYGGCVSPDAKYVLFTGNMEEDGDPGRAGAPMALMRLSDAPIVGGESLALRALHPGAKEGPVLTLPAGWEPCWTGSEVIGRHSSEAAGASSVMGVDATYHDAVPEAGAPMVDAPSTLIGATSGRAQLAAELRTKGWLVFSAKTTAGDWDLFVMRPDGSARRPITSTPGHNEAGARFSPDGRRLLYYRMPRAEPVDNNSYGTFDLVLANADGSDPVVFGTEFPWASWGPDGRQIACLAPKGIRIVDTTTSARIRELPRRGVVSQLVWSPDGRRFAGTANGLGPFWNIGCLELESGAIHAVSETERYNCTPDWTPDARGIVYARGIIPEQPGLAELWVASLDGTERRRLYAETAYHIYGACVSPDGQYLLFTRSREDLGQVPDIEMAIIRWPQGSDASASDQVRLDLGAGWEPHWTEREVIP
ncbi:MAG: PD40 domain-containing protein [Verrucomicrobia bacterium]|nr:PD40 domain-containing protein [Verrucomicrobiota bacterium]